MQRQDSNLEVKTSPDRKVPDSQPMSPSPIVMSGVTAREAEVVGWVVQGLTNKAIASKLQISARTVQKHMERMFKKLGVRSRAELVARAYMSGSSTGN